MAHEHFKALTAYLQHGVALAGGLCSVKLCNYSDLQKKTVKQANLVRALLTPRRNCCWCRISDIQVMLNLTA